MPMFFVLERRRGPKWDPSAPVEGQSRWDEHAAFMDGLVDDGFIVLGGPLADEHRVILAIEAASEDEVRSTLARDPWHESHLVVESVDPWTIRLDGRSRLLSCSWPSPWPTGRSRASSPAARRRPARSGDRPPGGGAPGTAAGRPPPRR